MLIVVSGPDRNVVVQNVINEPAIRGATVVTTNQLHANTDDYEFLTKSIFMRQVGEGRFIEWVERDGDFYGTRLDGINEECIKDIDVVISLDTNAVEKLMGINFPFKTVYVFVAFGLIEQDLSLYDFVVTEDNPISAVRELHWFIRKNREPQLPVGYRGNYRTCRECNHAVKIQKLGHSVYYCNINKDMPKNSPRWPRTPELDAWYAWSDRHTVCDCGCCDLYEEGLPVEEFIDRG